MFCYLSVSRKQTRLTKNSRKHIFANTSRENTHHITRIANTSDEQVPRTRASYDVARVVFLWSGARVVRGVVRGDPGLPPPGHRRRGDQVCRALEGEGRTRGGGAALSWRGSYLEVALSCAVKHATRLCVYVRVFVRACVCVRRTFGFVLSRDRSLGNFLLLVVVRRFYSKTRIAIGSSAYPLSALASGGSAYV